MALLSVVGLTLAAWLARRLSRVEFCPVCAGIAGTWLWMLAARAGGIAVDAAMLAILMGASVAGVAQWLGERLPPGRSVAAWKAVALPVGAAAAYGAASERWVLAAAAVIALCTTARAFGWAPRGAPRNDAAVAELEERMKKCC